MKVKSISILVALFLSSCSNYLDRPQPGDQIQLGQAFDRLEDVETALLGAYSILRVEELQLAIILYPDEVAGNLDYIGFLGICIFDEPLSTACNFIQGYWENSYKAINQVNMVVKLIDDNPDWSSNPFGQRLKGEALFLRGFLYAEMLKLFSKPLGNHSDEDLGLPLLTEPTLAISEIRYPVRASVEESYQQVFFDLESSLEFLPEENDRGRVSRFVALAYLAKANFLIRDYNKASEYASQILDAPFSLNSNPQIFFEFEGSPEEIWTIYHSEGERSRLNHFTGREFSIYSDEFADSASLAILPEKQLAELESQNLSYVDLRKSLLAGTVEDTANSISFSLKYNDPSNSDDAPIIRLAEIILIQAESVARIQGLNAQSLSLLNQIRSRSLFAIDSTGRPVETGIFAFKESDFASNTELIEAIIRERRVELVFEGNYLYDLIRLQRAVKNVPFDSDALRWPIPQSELDANKNLVQNPGY